MMDLYGLYLSETFPSLEIPHVLLSFLFSSVFLQSVFPLVHATRVILQWLLHVGHSVIANRSGNDSASLSFKNVITVINGVG